HPHDHAELVAIGEIRADYRKIAAPRGFHDQLMSMLLTGRELVDIHPVPAAQEEETERKVSLEGDIRAGTWADVREQKSQPCLLTGGQAGGFERDLDHGEAPARLPSPRWYLMHSGQCIAELVKGPSEGSKSSSDASMVPCSP